MQGKVEICGVNTSKLKVLKNEETMELLRRTKEGDMEAREQLIAGNLRLVLSVIQKFSNRGENLDDLFQVGCIGLIKAIDNFNTDLDVRFSTYGVPMIIGEIRRYLRDNSSVRVSRSMRDTAYRVLQAKEKFISEHQREPSIEEIAKLLELKREDVVFALDAILDPVSLYGLYGCLSGPGLPLGAGVLRWWGHHLCHGPGEGLKEYRRELAGAHRPQGGHEPPLRPGAAHPQPALLRGQDPNGGLRRGGHLSGPGLPPGKERD